MDTLEKLSEWLGESEMDRETKIRYGLGIYTVRLREYQWERGQTVTVAYGEGRTMEQAVEDALTRQPG